MLLKSEKFSLCLKDMALSGSDTVAAIFWHLCYHQLHELWFFDNIFTTLSADLSALLFIHSQVSKDDVLGYENYQDLRIPLMLTIVFQKTMC